MLFPFTQIEMRNMEAGKLTVFKCNDWLSKKRGDGALSRDLVAIVKGKTQLKSMNNYHLCNIFRHVLLV